ncbi:hypothetical protein [Streptomyces celluloflavus]|uniref:hypothetical protein n=1 Tax=Streptomyces celluloflavus TaxID=58344 RepID=UPI003695C3E6
MADWVEGFGGAAALRWLPALCVLLIVPLRSVAQVMCLLDITGADAVFDITTTESLRRQADAAPGQ